MRASLLLNATYEPIATIPATRAVTLLVADEAVSLEDSSTIFHSQHLEIPVPYVLKLNRYVKKNSYAKPANFAKHGVLIRDGYKCAYCGKHADTIDHVIPRKDGGASTYENCVAACGPCNRKKGHKSLKEMKWSLDLSAYTQPSPMAKMLARAIKNEDVFNSWSKYIFMFEPHLEQTFSKR